MICCCLNLLNSGRCGNLDSRLRFVSMLKGQTHRERERKGERERERDRALRETKRCRGRRLEMKREQHRESDNYNKQHLIFSFCSIYLKFMLMSVLSGLTPCACVCVSHIHTRAHLGAHMQMYLLGCHFDAASHNMLHFHKYFTKFT